MTAWHMARTGMRVHRIVSTATMRNGKVQTRWACNLTTYDPVEVTDPPEGSHCKICAESLHWPSSPCVYRCYDADDRLIYIGSSMRMAQRVMAHRRETRWWSEVARVETQPMLTLHEARLAEAAAITAENPLHNRRGRLRGAA